MSRCETSFKVKRCSFEFKSGCAKCRSISQYEFPKKKVIAFRLSRHHLSKRAPSDSFTSVAGDMAGAQAQVLLAAQISIWARLRGARLRDLDSAIWKEHTLVKAWCMRRTMFLVPSHEMAGYVRGTVRR